MRIIATVEVDLEATAIGTVSRLGDDLLGTPVLVRTLERLKRCEKVDGIFVLCRSEQRDRVAQLVEWMGVSVETHDAGSPPQEALIRTGRKWSLDGWRGGVGGACGFDEYVYPALLASLAKREGADAVVVVPPAAVLLDAGLTDALVDQYVEIHETMRMCFTQAPVGLAPIVLSCQLLESLAQGGVAPGAVLAYRPESPEADLILKECCYKAPAEITHASGRFLADCDGGVARVTAVLEAVGNDETKLDALVVSRWARRDYEKRLGALPREVEIELTTDDPLAGTLLRPRGECVGVRGPMGMGMVESIAEQVGAVDDGLVVLGGFGDPLRHPQFGEVLGVLRDAGVYGVAVRTPLVGASAGAIDALFEHEVDVVSVFLDAVNSETYRRVHGVDGFDEAVGAVEGLLAGRVARQQAMPLVVPEMVKARETVGEMEAFFDEWVRRAGWLVIEGYSHYAGQVEDRCVINMAPPQRVACRRLWGRLLVLADGRVVGCDRDFRGEYAVGDLGAASLGEIWCGAGMAALRDAHCGGALDGLPLCGRCDDWDRA